LGVGRGEREREREREGGERAREGRRRRREKKTQFAFSSLTDSLRERVASQFYCLALAEKLFGPESANFQTIFVLRHLGRREREIWGKSLLSPYVKNEEKNEEEEKGNTNKLF